MAHVTVPEEDTRKIYAVDGTPEDTFTISATFYNEDTDIEVYVDGVLQTSGVTITGTPGTDGGFEGGTAVLDTPVSNATVVVNVDIPVARTYDQPNSADFDIEGVNTDLDKQITLFQQFTDRIKRCLKLDVTSSLVDGDGDALDLIIPNPTANALIGWNTSANALTNITITSLELSGLDSVFSGLANNDFFIYDSGDTRWENRTGAEVLTILGLDSEANIKSTTGMQDPAFDAYASQAEAEAGASQVKNMHPLNTAQAITAQAIPLIAAFFPNGFMSGLVPETGAGDAAHELDFSAGYVVDADGVTAWSSPAMTKDFEDAWAAGDGNGGLFNGSLANNTFYNIYAIYNPTTGDSDIGADTIANGITYLPAGYTKYRLVTSFLTDGSANIVAMTWDEMALGRLRAVFADTQKDHDAAATNGSTGTVTMTVPTGRQVDALFRASANNASSVCALLFSTPGDQTAEAPGSAFANGNHSLLAASGGGCAGEFCIRTNSSGQINERAAAASTNLDINTQGWIESRM